MTKIDRRKFLAGGAYVAAAPLALSAAKLQRSDSGKGRDENAAAAESFPGPAAPQEWGAQWIWYPGQLAAWRHARRIRLALARCTAVGYPGNFRQPVTETYFRNRKQAAKEMEVRWAGPEGRIRAMLAGRGGDVTRRKGTVPAGGPGIEIQIDFAQSLPCLLLEGGEFSTGSGWEASLDGKKWVAAETGGGGNPLLLPDREREIVKSLAAARTAWPAGAAAEKFQIERGRDVVLDFEETEVGSLRFAARGQGELLIQVGESVEEARDPDPKNFEQSALPPIALTGDLREIVLPERGLRYARFSVSGSAEIAGARFDAKMWPGEPHGRFTCSDTELNRIWDVAVATLRSNMHDFYLDGIRRDALLWHDGPLTLEAYERVFFDADLSRQTLVAETLPENPSLRDVGIIDGPMYTVIGFEREYLARGDAAFSRMFRERIEDILNFYRGLQNERGFVDAEKVQPYGFFPDWSATEESGPDGHGTPAYGQMLLSAAFAAGARLAEAWGDSEAAQRNQKSAEILRGAVRETFWSARHGVYWNGLNRSGALDQRLTSFAQAFAIACGVAKPEEHGKLFAFLDDDTKRPAHYSLSQVMEMTAYAKAGRAEPCDPAAEVGVVAHDSARVPEIF
jgi:hypothetical protein